MIRTREARTCLCALAYVALAACSQPTTPRDAKDVLDFETSASEGDLRAARLLSLSNNGAVQAISDPYELAVSCIVSIGFLAQRFRAVSPATPAQLRAFDEAVGIYQRRALETGNTRAQLTRDVEARGQTVDPAQNTRIGISCLRQLT